MIAKSVFDQRLAICKACRSWSNICLKGHALQSPTGCPDAKFPPVDGAAVAQSAPVIAQDTVSMFHTCCTEEANSELKPLSYAEAAKRFAQAMSIWQRGGFKLVTDDLHNRRLAVCKACPGGHYRWFQCKLCKCVVALKAKLPDESCPASYWPSS